MRRDYAILGELAGRNNWGITRKILSRESVDDILLAAYNLFLHITPPKIVSSSRGISTPGHW